mmetsp:Transcript_92/g.194  ORF Transcript_92/g.194 Transcript_92/m.194 type:complete len:175 (-) Transcript_92:421-945(-)|eukprot:CAMPEP_0196663046 /NCGR_PEP_ID=MMETSP1086-20130531/51217_1 /TAXON_ID=77921 /ORGANISM="Cyanoptyche  gloeocystis , Strain SAG4.97" /LENGTH=174 /DNA_ID=CAMNT_0041998713 /DNA_START=101 /DNA_END=625 /DNA_ORIENTATION=-
MSATEAAQRMAQHQASNASMWRAISGLESSNSVVPNVLDTFRNTDEEVSEENRAEARKNSVYDVYHDKRPIAKENQIDIYNDNPDQEEDLIANFMNGITAFVARYSEPLYHTAATANSESTSDHGHDSSAVMQPMEISGTGEMPTPAWSDVVSQSFTQMKTKALSLISSRPHRS